MARVFVYGTLRKLGGNNRLMGTSQFLGEIRTAPSFKLYRAGHFPGMVPSDAGQAIAGELYECDADVVENLDRYECIHWGLFRRVEIELEDKTTAEAYLFCKPVECLIESGDWLQEKGICHGPQEEGS